jgi:hypothetical protein
MKKIIAVLLIAVFSVTAAFAADTKATGTPVPTKSAKKMFKHHGKKAKTAKPAATPVKTK